MILRWLESLRVECERASRAEFKIRLVLMQLPACAFVILFGRSLQAQEIHQPSSPVPPALEIEVLDPGVDPLGHPSVLLRDSDDPLRQEVDIPPTVLVHHYYYTGDRDFQAQLLPGGPCIAVMNHPRTGERTYVPVQMQPGAPRVKYTGHRIEYDFGNRGISIVFIGKKNPSVRYRNGEKLATKVSSALGIEHAVTHVRKFQTLSTRTSDKAKTVVTGTGLFAADAVGGLLRPIKQVVQLGPFSGVGDRLSERVERHKSEKELKSGQLTERQWVRRFP